VKLIIIRHGAAGDRHEWEAQGRDDRLRPLTAEGKKEMKRAAAGLARLVPTVDLVATSPWVRAAETAAIVASECGADVVTLEQLTPEHHPDAVVRWLGDQRDARTVALVGHEPHLSTLVGYLLISKPTAFIDLKKGGAALVDLTIPPQPGTATLQWLLTSKQLSRFGE
jgi:phosphohistidine phosphatase